MEEAQDVVDHVNEEVDKSLSYRDMNLLPVIAELAEKYVDQRVQYKFFQELKEHLQVDDVEKDSRLFYARVSTCTLCPNLSDPQVGKYNTKNPDVLFITSTPITRAETAAPIVEGCREAGLSSEQICLTSVVKCASGGKPSLEAMATCATTHLFSEIDVLSPRWIVACGSLALSTLTGKVQKITQVASSNFILGPWRIRATYDPNYVLKREGLIEDLHSDILYVSRHLEETQHND